MECIEQIADIVKIEAYPVSAFSLPFLYTTKRTYPRSAVTFDGQPLKLSLKENTANIDCNREISESGSIFKITASWQTDDTESETLEQIGKLETSKYHFLARTASGQEKLIYNFDNGGRTTSNDSLSGETQTVTLNFSVSSRIPVLTLV